MVVGGPIPLLLNTALLLLFLPMFYMLLFIRLGVSVKKAEENIDEFCIKLEISVKVFYCILRYVGFVRNWV